MMTFAAHINKATLTWLFSTFTLLLAAPIGAQTSEAETEIANSETTTKTTALVGHLALSSTALPGNDMVVAWSGPGLEGDAIYVYRIGASKPITKVSARSTDYKPAIIKAPQQQGEYQLRLISGEQELARAAFSVVSADAWIKLLTPIVLSGESISIEWSGPRSPGDYLSVSQVGGGASFSSLPASGTVDARVSLSSPKVAGQYQVRLQNRKGEVLAARVFTVR